MSTVLVVDDNVPMAHAIASLVQTVGCETEIAMGGKIAFDMIRAREFDLVVLDNHMPDMSGCDLLRLLGEKGVKAPPIVMCSASEEGREESMRLGAAAFVTKDRMIEDLLPMVEEHILGAAGEIQN